MGCVGQQAVEGHRILPKAGSRVLSCFDFNDKSAASRGFVQNAYSRGLNAAEFFFHAMGGREGLVDTAVKTADTGYLQRRLVKAMESLVVDYTSAVRDPVNNIIQYQYGTDGFNSTFLEQKQYLRFITYTNQQLYDEIIIPAITITTQEYNDILQLKQQVLQSKLCLMSPILDVVVYLPVSVPRIIETIIEDQKSCQNLDYTNMTATALVDFSTTSIDEYCPRSPVYRADSPPLTLDDNSDNVNAEFAQQIYSDVEDLCRECCAKSLYLRAYLKYHLTCKKIIYGYALTLEQWKKCLATIRTKYYRAQIHAGEAVGALSAESLGEPSTQCTLNTFHYSGVASKNVTLGVPRIKELIDLLKEIRTPSLTIFLKPSPLYQDNEQALKTFSNSLERTYLEDVVHATDMLYEPDIFKCARSDIQYLIDIYSPFLKKKKATGHSKWLYTLELSKIKLLTKNITCEDVVRAIMLYSGQTYHIMASPNNMSKWMILLRLNDIEPMISKYPPNKQDKFDRYLTLNTLLDLLSHVIIGGVDGIEKTSTRVIERTVLDSRTGEPRTEKETIIDTEGTALMAVWTLPAVDFRRTYSNDVREVASLLGIEAAATLLFHEIKTVLSFDGSYINDRHIAITVNTMTYRGYLMSFTRHGINREDAYGILAKASFEEPMDVLLDSAAVNDIDPILGVSERIIVGNGIRVGTNYFKLRYDKSKYYAITDAADAAAPLYLSAASYHGVSRTFIRHCWLRFGGETDRQKISFNNAQQPPLMLDSPPPTPLLSATKIETKTEIETAADDTQTNNNNNNNNNTQHPYNDNIDDMAYTPTMASRNYAPLESFAPSPHLLPMQFNNSGYKLSINASTTKDMISLRRATNQYTSAYYCPPSPVLTVYYNPPPILSHETTAADATQNMQQQQQQQQQTTLSNQQIMDILDDLQHHVKLE